MLDVVVLLAVLALVPDLLIFRPEAAAGGDLAAALETGIVQFHHDFLLGPANEVLHGHPMLAPTASQYGVTSIYLLAGWFQLAPIGYGTLGLLTGALTALWFGAGYGILRLAGTARLLSAAALGVAVVALAYNLAYPVGALPQSGPLRFGLPMALVLCAVAAAARGRRGRARGDARGARRPRPVGGLVARVVRLHRWRCSPCWRAARLAGRRAGRAAAVARRGPRSPARPPASPPTLVFALATLAAPASCPTGASTSSTCASSCSATVGDLTYDVERWTPGPRGRRRLRWSRRLALAELVRRDGDRWCGGSARRSSRSRARPPTASCC